MASLSRTTTQSSIARRNHDKSIYDTTPVSSFSSADSSQTLTQSTSNISHASASPTLQETPPRSSRSRTRYPDLGRVPLHRRGTSKTYERLEDLLREAGYKETRVFTPEGEREAAARDSTDKAEDRKSTVGAVVGFFAGLVAGSTSTSTSRPPSVLRTAPDDPVSDARYSPPPSPLEYRTLQKQKARCDGSYMTSSLESWDPTPRPSRFQRTDMSRRYEQQEHIHHPHPRAAPSYASERYLRKQLSNASLAYQQQPQPQQQARPRHAAPTIPRPSSTPARRRTIVLNDSDTEETERPPLPRTWLETVARAVLFGGSGAHVGGPTTSPQRRDEDRGRSQTLRNSRSSLSQASRRKRSARRHKFAENQFLAPPPLLGQLERGRSERSIVEVSHMRVVCRSAPGSRAGSAVRGEKRGRGRLGREGRERERVPSLARTRAEGEIWVSGKRDEEENEEERNASSDDDDNIDLSRILVPPKRQNSINSLRKHLLSGEGPGNALRRTASARSVWSSRAGEGRVRPLAEEEEEEEWGVPTSSGDHGEEGEGDLFDGRRWGSGRSAGGKRRLGLPNHWGAGRS